MPAPGGGISYCRTGGGTGGYYTICTKLDPVTLAWGADVSSPVTDIAYAENRSWVAFKTGPALCGRVGSSTAPRIGYTVQTSTGWRFIGLPRNTDWSYADARAWVPAPGGGISYCRTGGGTGGYYTICTKLDPVTLAWGADVSSPVTDLTYSDSFA